MSVSTIRNSESRIRNWKTKKSFQNILSRIYFFDFFNGKSRINKMYSGKYVLEYFEKSNLKIIFKRGKTHAGRSKDEKTARLWVMNPIGDARDHSFYFLHCSTDFHNFFDK